MKVRSSGRLDQVHHRVVDHPVAKGGGGDDARLALVDPEQAVGAGPVVAVLQFALQAKQLLFQIQREAGHVRAPALAAARLAVGEQQVLEAHDPGPDAAEPLHGASRLCGCCAASRRSAGPGRPSTRRRARSAGSRRLPAHGRAATDAGRPPGEDSPAAVRAAWRAYRPPPGAAPARPAAPAPGARRG